MNPQELLLEQIKRGREEHAALTEAAARNFEAMRASHKAKVTAEDKRIKAAWDEIANARVQFGITKAEQDKRSKEQAAWQRRIDGKEAELKDFEATLRNHGNEIQDRINKLRAEMEAKVITLRELLEQCELQIHLL